MPGLILPLESTLNWLKTDAISVPGLPAAMSAIPDSGPKPKRYVCVPSAIVA
jgi:hypothetical protein